MTKGTEFVTYGLYKDSARSLPWGAGAGALYAGTGTGASQNLAIYAIARAQATPSPGVYSDAVVVSLTY
jgi:spore coat protein U-like protein